MQKELNASNSAIPTRNSVLKALVEDGTIKNAGAMMDEAEENRFSIPEWYSGLLRRDEFCNVQCDQ